MGGLRDKLANTVWNSTRPHCLDVDVALASISDTLAYYAVPSMQKPGFLTEGAQGSSRMNLDNPITTTTEATTRSVAMSGAGSTASTITDNLSTVPASPTTPTAPATTPTTMPVAAPGAAT